MLFDINKFELELRSYRDDVMATLIARRLHNYSRKDPNFKKLGIRFITSESAGKTRLYIASTKVRALDNRSLALFENLAKTYESILEPFFSRK